MKITRSQLRRIIKEAVSGSEPQALYDRLKELEGEYSSHFYLLDRLGEEVYSGAMNLLQDMHQEDKSYNNYGNFLAIVRKKPYGIQPSSAHKLWFGPSGRGGPLVIKLQDMSQEVKEYKDLKGQFKSVNATSQSDAVYGRKRTNIIHEPTGTVINSSTDRKGSLGT